MQLRWKNILAGLLTIVVIVLLIRNPTLFQVVADNLRGIGPGHSADEKTLGLITLGLICILIVAIVRLLVSGEDPGDRDDRGDPGDRH
jgi:hypothetical protein